MILLAYLNGVVLLPVILSIVGPPPLPLEDQGDDVPAGKHVELKSPSQIDVSIAPDRTAPVTAVEQGPGSGSGNAAAAAAAGDPSHNDPEAKVSAV